MNCAWAKWEGKRSDGNNPTHKHLYNNANSLRVYTCTMQKLTRGAEVDAEVASFSSCSKWKEKTEETEETEETEAAEVTLLGERS